MSADIDRISSDEQPHPPLVEHATCISSDELQGEFSVKVSVSGMPERDVRLVFSFISMSILSPFRMIQVRPELTGCEIKNLMLGKRESQRAELFFAGVEIQDDDTLGDYQVPSTLTPRC